MPAFSLWIDPLSALAVYALAVAGTWFWVCRSSQTQVAASDQTMRRIVTRVAIIVACLAVLCYLVNVAFWVPIVIFLLLILAVLGGDAIGIIGLPAVALAYMMKEYVLGFPELILDPPSPAEREQRDQGVPPPHLGKVARVTAPLRPIGEIELDEQRQNAASESGLFIDQGRSVVIVGKRNGTLLVREQATD